LRWWGSKSELGWDFFDLKFLGGIFRNFSISLAKKKFEEEFYKIMVKFEKI
jgi:hypothetical protein